MKPLRRERKVNVWTQTAAARLHNQNLHYDDAFEDALLAELLDALKACGSHWERRCSEAYAASAVAAGAICTMCEVGPHTQASLTTCRSETFTASTAELRHQAD